VVEQLDLRETLEIRTSCLVARMKRSENPGQGLCILIFPDCMMAIIVIEVEFRLNNLGGLYKSLGSEGGSIFTRIALLKERENLYTPPSNLVT